MTEAAVQETEYWICSRCHCRRPLEHFEGTTRCRRCRASKKAEAERKRRVKYPGLVEVPRAAPRASEAFSSMDVSPAVNLATRLKHLLRLRMKPEELAERLVALARSADERIASASLETLMNLQGVIVPKRPEEQSEQRFFVMSSSLTPRVDLEPPQPDSSLPDKPPS